MKKSRESWAVHCLLSQSGLPYKPVLAGLEETDIRGWRNIRPGAVYDLSSRHQAQQQPRRTTRGNKPRSWSSQPARRDTTDPSSYMSGELDRSYNYVYKGGLSKQAGSMEPLPPLSTSQHTTVHLDPALRYHSNGPEQHILAKIVAMQLKPELLVEHIIIENRLRQMNIDDNRSIRHLNLEGMGVDPRAIPELDKGVWLQAAQASMSAPVLSSSVINPHRKTKRRKRPPHLPLDWCTLNTDRTREDSEVGLGLGGPNVSPNLEPGGRHAGLVDTGQGGMGDVIEGGRDHLSMERALLQTRQALAKSTSYRLPKLQVTPDAHQGPPKVQVTPQERLQEAVERARVRPNPAQHIPVVSPSLRALGGTWQPGGVKYTSKLRSLGW